MRIRNKLAPALLGFALAAATASLAAESPASKADQLLAAAKRATGGPAWNKLKSLAERGTLAGGSVSGSYESLTDVRHVRALQKFTFGPVAGTQGWTGTHAWTADANGQVQANRADIALATYRAAYAFYFPGRWPAARTYVGERHADGATYDAIKVAPKGAEPFEIWFDRASHRIAREVDLVGADLHTRILSDYRDIGTGVLMPFSVRETVGNGAEDRLATVAALTAGTTQPAERFEPPAVPAS